MRESQLQVFYEKGKQLTLEEATNKAQLFYDYAVNCVHLDFCGDYWFGLADNWDLNIWLDNFDDFSDSDKYKLTLYRVANGATDTTSGFDVTLEESNVKTNL